MIHFHLKTFSGNDYINFRFQNNVKVLIYLQCMVWRIQISLQ